MGIRSQTALLVALAGACFSGDATLGSICREDRDCGAEQACDNEVCGRCGDGFAQPGELCFRDGDRIVLGTAPVVIRPADIDRNGVLDLVALAPGDDALQVLRGAGRSFEAPERVALPTVGYVFAVGDLDADGTTDALVSDGQNIRVGLGSGALAFSFADELVLWPAVTALEFVPLTESSTAFAVASRPATAGGTELVALHLDAGPTLRIGADAAVPGDAFPIGSAELLGDGRRQVVVLAGTRVVILSGRELEPGLTLDYDRTLTTVALVDADGDGIRDVVAVDDEGTLTIDTGDGTGMFTRQEPIALGVPASALIVGDLDRDGDRDFAVATLTQGVLVQLARGRIYPETTKLGGPAHANDLLVADLDGDTLPELIVSSASTGEISLLEIDP